MPGSIRLHQRFRIAGNRYSPVLPVSLLINTGVYRHKNTGEPAIAAIIQREIGADGKKTFPFDLNNGGCGWLTGIEVAGTLMQSGDIRYGMVVTGDSEPFQRSSDKYIFEPAAAAITLGKSKDSKELHTAGPAFALWKSWADNLFQTAQTVLFITIGSGISVSLALYRN